MILTLSMIISLYALCLLIAILGWQFTFSPNLKDNGNVFFSVLIPIRNEEQDLKDLFTSLSAIDFPYSRFEIIFIDDHSNDSSKEIIFRELNKSAFNGKLITLSDLSGKKAALAKGITHAKGDVIITTDADCIVPSNWLKSYCVFYDNLEAQLVFGPVCFHEEQTFFENLQTMEFSTLIGVGATGLTLGIPNMCNGANLSFKKEVFYQVGGYKGNEQIASGDDEFLMHKVYKAFKTKVFFNKNVDAIVKTHAQPSLSKFFNQRKRWAGKWKYYTNWQNVILSLFIFFINLSVFIAMVLVVSDFRFYKWLLLPLGLKLIFEWLFIFMVMSFLKRRFSIIPFLLLQLSYPIYALFFGIAANFGRYTWKGRKH